ncbi:MAG: class I SAM-dependent methyltransferase family protein [Candidatus Nanoarchaeia archaeon]|nr:class I SAM-dependent methyltransferase family protein [Candidatus Nanoarchaeia archaeon]
MVECLKVSLKDAQKKKKELLDKNVLSDKYYPLKEKGFIYFPVLQDGDSQKELISRNKKIILPFKKALEKILNKEELKQVKTAFDTIGTIAILEIPESLNHKAKEIAQVLLQSNPTIKTVLRKTSIHEGVFRTQERSYLAGEDTQIAKYKENGVDLEVNVSEVYFSVRLSTERTRISQLVQEGEDILVMFSGAAPYPCVLSKNTLAKSMVGVEINPVGHEFGLKNVAKNKIKNVQLYCGDVREVVPKLNLKFDRIIMPLPKTAEQFLDVALNSAKKGCIIHLYGFYDEDKFEEAKKETLKLCKELGYDVVLENFVLCGQHAPRSYRVCFDLKVE